MRVEVQPGWHVETKLRKEPFYPGEQFNLDDNKEVSRLIDLGIVKPATGDPVAAGFGSPAPLNSSETIKLIMAATLADLAKFKSGEERKGVLDAIAKREQQIEKSDIETVASMASLDDINAVFADETRPAVLEAIEKRRAELTAPAE